MHIKSEVVKLFSISRRKPMMRILLVVPVFFSIIVINRIAVHQCWTGMISQMHNKFPNIGL